MRVCLYLSFFVFFIVISLESESGIKDFKKIYDTKKRDFPYYGQMAKELMKDNFFYSAIPYMKEALYLKKEKPIEVFDKLLDYNLKVTGRVFFEDFSDGMLKKSNSFSMIYIRAYRHFFKGEYELANNLFSLIPKGHFLHPHSLFFQGSIKAFNNQFKLAHAFYKECSKKAGSQDYSSISEKVYFEFIKDSCEVAFARTLYKMKQNKVSDIFYNRISKKSFSWPYALLEDSWNTYLSNDYNRTIGRLYTYNAPFLTSYFFAETEILKTISFSKMCLWDEALEVVRNFEKTYYSEGNRALSLIRETRNNKKYFIGLLDGNFDYKNSVLNNFLHALRVNPLFISFLHDSKKMNLEYKRIQKIGESEIKRELLSNLFEVRDTWENKFNHFVRVEILKHLNEIMVASTFLSKMNLNIYSKKKSVLTKKTEIEEEKDDYINIMRRTDQYFFGKVNEFWLDELGNYVFALKSKCPSTTK